MIISIVRKEATLLVKDKGTVFWMFILPILFVVIFAAIFGQSAENKGEAIAQIVPGYTVMFVFFIMITMVQSFLRDRDSGMITRLKGTAMGPIQYLIGMWIPNIGILLIQSVMMLGFGHLVYGLPIANVFATSLLIIALAICATGLGLFLSMIVSSLNMGVAVVQVVAMGGAILGGLWFPWEMLPKAVQVIGNFTPQYWAHTALKDVVVGGKQVTDIGAALGILLGIGLIGLVLALFCYPRFSRKG